MSHIPAALTSPQVLIWALYFDNFPHGHYGTIRQQIWSVLHFPFQLAIVGVVEGSQQVALARYVLKNWQKIDDSILQYCTVDNLDGGKLRDALLKLLDYWDFEAKYETYAFQELITNYTYVIGNDTGICSPANATSYIDSGVWPDSIAQVIIDMFDGVYIGLGMKLPVDKLEKSYALDIAIKSWKLVYLYYWTSFAVLIGSSIIFLILIRRHKSDLFDWVSIGFRVVVLVIGGALIGLIANKNALYAYLRSWAVLPTCLILLFLILVFDKASAAFCNWQLRRSGQAYAKEYEEHGHGHGHGEAHEHSAHASGVALGPDSMAYDRKSTTWTVVSADRQPLTQNTEYHGAEHGYAMTPMSPPLQSPPMQSPGHVIGGHAPGGYMPVSNTQNYGA